MSFTSNSVFHAQGKHIVWWLVVVSCKPAALVPNATERLKCITVAKAILCVQSCLSVEILHHIPMTPMFQISPFLIPFPCSKAKMFTSDCSIPNLLRRQRVRHSDCQVTLSTNQFGTWLEFCDFFAGVE